MFIRGASKELPAGKGPRGALWGNNAASGTCAVTRMKTRLNLSKQNEAGQRQHEQRPGGRGITERVERQGRGGVPRRVLSLWAEE